MNRGRPFMQIPNRRLCSMSLRPKRKLLPWRTFVAQELSQGRIPLWNRFSFCGAPFLANLQSAVLYPIDRIVDLFLDPPRALMAGVAIHLFLGGAFLFSPR